MKKIIIVLSILAALCGCTKEPRAPKAGERLADIYVLSPAGEKTVYVEAQGLWRVTPLESWISTDVAGRGGRGAVTLRFDSNESDASNICHTRLGHILITDIATEKADTLVLIQQGIPDGKAYESKVYSSKVEFADAASEHTCSVAYVNLRGVTDPQAIVSWASTFPADIAAIIVDPSLAPILSLVLGSEGVVCSDNLLIVAREETPVVTSTVGGLHAVTSCGGISVVDLQDIDAELRPAAFREYLLAGYNAPGSPSFYLALGAFYHLSAMECGYQGTPSWYPTSLRDVRFASDLYAWKNNLLDCYWMVSPQYNAVYTDETGASWRPDYVYASTKAFNTLIDVKAVDIPLAGAEHKAFVVTMKY